MIDLITNFNMDTSQNPSSSIATDTDVTDFELSDYLVLQDGFEEEFSPPDVVVSAENIGGVSVESDVSTPMSSNMQVGYGAGATNASTKVAFRMKSETEILNDGFRWRKYGKKMVKNNRNPRNYFKCLSGGCKVKKRVERDSEDPSYVITTYVGIHNHESPSVVYYDQTPLLNIPQYGFTLQPSTSHHSHSQSHSSSS